ncbi:hypothetical protein JL721_5719 [Aureococcus anophagefferens]|nr:hypothetical protein JL721_5719 [Aureococcus anophagefferens]
MGAGGLAYLQNWGPGGPLGMHDASLGPEQLETVHCPQALVGRLIGKQGDTIKDLQRRSGARIQIDQNFPEGTPRVVTVEGSAQCVALGVQLVRSLIGNSPAVGNGNPGKMTTFECPKALVGRVIGKGGETINELQRRSGARIQIEQRVPEGAPCIIGARGVRMFVAASLLVAPAASARARVVSRDRARARPQVQGSDAAVEEARRLTHDVMGGKRLEPFAGGVAYYGPGAPPGAGYGIPPYLVPQTGGVDFAGGLAQYSRAASRTKLAAKRGSGVRAPPRAPTRADPQADGRAPSGGVLYPPPGAYGAVTPDGWTSHVDGQGRQYWHHATSGQSSWDAPPSQSP